MDLCASRLRAAIMQGELKPGSRLPSERSLATSFAVNRVTVRSALAQLASVKLLTVRHGSGYLVNDFMHAGGPSLIPGLANLADQGQLGAIASDLLLVRRQLAQAVLQRLAVPSSAANTSDAEQTSAPIVAAISQFATLIDQLEGIGNDSWSEADLRRFAEADMRVIAAILDASKSAVLQLCMNPLTQVVLEIPRLRAVMYANPRSNIIGYQVLVAWLAERNPEHIEDIVGELVRRDDESLRRINQLENDSP